MKKAQGRRQKEDRNPTREKGCLLAAARRSWNTIRRSSLRLSPSVLRPCSLVLLYSSFFILHYSFLVLAATTNSPGPDAIPPLRPPHAEMPPTFWEQYGLWVVLFGILLLALVCAAAWFLSRSRPPEVVPPEDQARRALEPLRQQPEDGALLSRVSQVLRRYVAAAFELPPGELTTAEFCRATASHARIGPELSAALSEFLRQCDQRKFSPPAPAPPLSAVAQALQLIHLAEARRSQSRRAAEAQATAGKAGA